MATAPISCFLFWTARCVIWMVMVPCMWVSEWEVEVCMHVCVGVCTRVNRVIACTMTSISSCIMSANSKRRWIVNCEYFFSSAFLGEMRRTCSIGRESIGDACFLFLFSYLFINIVEVCAVNLQKFTDNKERLNAQEFAQICTLYI